MTSCQHPRTLDLGLLLVRGMVGVVFLYHGSQKLFGAFGGDGIDGFTQFLTTLGVPAPGISAYLAALSEFVAGLSLVLGLFVHVLPLPVIVTMLVACFTVHAGKFDSQKGGMEYPLLLAFCALSLALTGAGRFSLDELLCRRTTRQRTIAAPA
jgi:putative oxidoreductase